MQQGIKKLQGFEYLKVVLLEILNAELCRVFANQVTFVKGYRLIVIITWTSINNLHKLSDTQPILMHHSVGSLKRIVGLSFSKLSFKVASV